MHIRLRRKLEAIRQDHSCGEFILADAKDPDMAWGIQCFGRQGSSAQRDRFRSRPEFLAELRGVVDQGIVDILLASVSTMSVVAHQEDLFASSDVTPAVRANDTTDIWLPRGGRYRESPSRPFRTCDLREAQYGTLSSQHDETPRVNLGLYSITFNNDLERDLASLTAYRQFRTDCSRHGFHHFLEVFAPNIDAALPPEAVAPYMNDMICRALAAVSLAERPEFLKIPYLGPAALEELVNYDPAQVVGIMGGSSGTTYDAFKLLETAQRHGARAALFGRKIKDAEAPLIFIEHLRRIVAAELVAEEAVKSYHSELEKLEIPRQRSLEEDLRLTDPVLCVED